MCLIASGYEFLKVDRRDLAKGIADPSSHGKGLLCGQSVSAANAFH